MRFPPFMMACLLVLSLFRSSLGIHIVKVAWVLLSYYFYKIKFHSFAGSMALTIFPLFCDTSLRLRHSNYRKIGIKEEILKMLGKVTLYNTKKYVSVCPCMWLK